jgi:hypothetical protein
MAVNIGSEGKVGRKQVEVEILYQTKERLPENIGFFKR